MLHAGRKWFFIGDTKSPAVNGKYTIGGFCSCTVNAAKFLEIEDIDNISPTGGIVIKRDKHQKTSERAGDNGTPSVIEVGESSVMKAFPKNPGRNVIILRTNDVIVNSKSKAKTKPKHTISFAFPGWATSLDISDLLASIIPENKFGDNTNQIQRSFTRKGGRSYAIMLRAKALAATGEQGADLPITQAEVDALLAKIQGNP